VILRALEKHREMRYQSQPTWERNCVVWPCAKALAWRPRFRSRKRRRKNSRWSCSYRRNVQPTNRSCVPWRKIGGQGYSVFVDRHLLVGVDWRTRSSTKSGPRTRWSPCFPPPRWKARCSPTRFSLRTRFRASNGKPRLLPVRVQFHAELPDSLHSALMDSITLSGEIRQIMTRLSRTWGSSRGSAGGISPPAEPGTGGRSAAARFEVLHRPSTDQEFYSAVARNDSIVLLKGARQMGKTSLMARGLQQARKAGARVVLTDFQKLNSTHLQSVDNLLLCLAQAIAEQLDLDVAPEEKLERAPRAQHEFERFLRRQILSQVNGHLVWGMDEVDRLFACDFGSEVFGLFRSGITNVPSTLPDHGRIFLSPLPTRARRTCSSPM